MLLDPQDQPLVVEGGWSDREVGNWGGRIHQIATTASVADTDEVQRAGQAILDYMPDMTFEAEPLFDLGIALAEACVASGLSTGDQLHDALVD